MALDLNTLLGLPGEVRNQIYSVVFKSLSEPPHHPWEDWRTWKSYVHLLLTCRQVHGEAESLFQKEVSQVTLHFDNVPDLFDFATQEAKRLPHLACARFSIRATLQRSDKRPSPITLDIETLIRSQPGLDRLQCLVLYLAEPVRDCYEHLHKPKCGSENHSTCKAMAECVEYKKLDWPSFNNGCQVTSYEWSTRLTGKWRPARNLPSPEFLPSAHRSPSGGSSDIPVPVRHCSPSYSRGYHSARYDPNKYYIAFGGCVVLSGRLRDLSFDGVNMKAARETLLAYEEAKSRME